MLSVAEVVRVRTIVDSSERIIIGVNRLLQRANHVKPMGLLDMRAKRCERDLHELEKLTTEMVRLCQELMIHDYLSREGIGSPERVMAS